MTKKKVRTPALELSNVSALTDNQEKVFQAYDSGSNLLLHGYAGTGKSFMALYLALEELEDRKYKKVVIIRSVLPTRDIGALPGDISEKSDPYETPYVKICSQLYQRNNAYEVMIQKGKLEFATTSYLRGVTFEDSIIIVDEIQNMTFQELDTIMTRIGGNTRIIFCGDFRQTDLKYERDMLGLQKFMTILKDLADITYIELEVDDIVRSGIVKDYIIRRTENGY